MKKLDVNTVGSVWAVILIVAAIAYFSTLHPVIALWFAGFISIMGAPHVVTYLWNKFVADEDEEETR